MDRLKLCAKKSTVTGSEIHTFRPTTHSQKMLLYTQSFFAQLIFTTSSRTAHIYLAQKIPHSQNEQART